MSLSQETIDTTLRTSHGQKAYEIVEKLHDAGHEAWWVGGSVRDMARGVIPEDIDIGTDALPEKVVELFTNTDDSAAEFGSILVTIGSHTFEVTTFREDDQVSDGRHPESVVFADREKDAARRDITINALYWNPISSELFDPYDGMADLKEGLIRFIGDPGIRIKHDALRILRVVRFRASIHGQYHPETYKALQEHASTVEILSGERCLRELEKMLLCPHPEVALEDLWEIGSLQYIIPELHACKGIPQPADYHKEGDVWEHTKKCTENFSDDHGIDVRIAALFHDIGKSETFSLDERIRFNNHASVSGEEAKAILERLNCPRKRIDKIVWIIKHHMMMGTFTELREESKGKWYFHPWFSELLQVFWLDIAGTEPSEFGLLNSIIDDFNAFVDRQPKPPKKLLSGDEVMEILGIGPGEKIGEALKLLHEAQLRKEVISKSEAVDFLSKHKKVL